MYLINAVASILGISRTTLLYYIEQGVVHPIVDEESGYRYFSEKDISTLKYSTALRNIGLSVKEIAAFLCSSDSKQREETIRTHAESLRRRIERDQLFLLAAEALIRNDAPVTQPELIHCPAYYNCYTGCETGYHFMTNDPASIAVLRNVPVSGFSMTYDERLFDEEPTVHYKSGRAVRVEDAKVLGINPAGMNILGGCLCVHIQMHCEKWTKDLAVIRNLAAYIRENNLKIVGDPFCPNVVSYRPDGQKWQDIYVPVEKA